MRLCAALSHFKYNSKPQICQEVGMRQQDAQKQGACAPCFFEIRYLPISVISKPLLSLSLGYRLDVLLCVRRSLAAVCVKEVKTCGSLIKCLLKALSIAEVALCVLLYKSSCFCVVFSFANDFFHDIIPFLLIKITCRGHIITEFNQNCKRFFEIS